MRPAHPSILRQSVAGAESSFAMYTAHGDLSSREQNLLPGHEQLLYE